MEFERSHQIHTPQRVHTPQQIPTPHQIPTPPSEQELIDSEKHQVSNQSAGNVQMNMPPTVQHVVDGEVCTSLADAVVYSVNKKWESSSC